MCRATQDGRVTEKSSEKTRSTGGENGKPLQYSCRKNPMNSMKRKKDMTPENGPHRSEGVQCTTGKEQRQLLTAPERMKQQGQRGNNMQLWMCLLVKVKSDAVMNKTTWEAGMLGP